MDHGGVVVVEDVAGAVFARLGVVARAADGVDGEAQPAGHLHGRAAHGRGGAPDQEAPALLLRLAGDAEAEEDADAGGGDGHGEHGALLERDAVWDFHGRVLVEEGVRLESAVVDVAVADGGGETGDAIAFAEERDVRGDGFDDAADVAAEDVGVFGEEEAVVLDLPVHGVGCEGAVLDEEFRALGLGDGAVLHLEAGFGRGDDGGGVGHGGWLRMACLKSRQ